MDESSGLERVIGTLAAQRSFGQPAQFAVNSLEQIRLSVGIAFANPFEVADELLSLIRAEKK